MNLFKILLCIMIMLTNSISMASPYMDRVNVIIPFSAGGGTTRLFLNFQKYVMDNYNINLISQFKPGGQGLVGLSELNKMPSDGSVIQITTSGIISIQRIKLPEIKLTIIGGISSMYTSALVVNHASNIKTLSDLKIRAHQENISIAWNGAPELKIVISQLSNIINSNNDITLVPFTGGNQAKLSLLGNHITAAMLPYSSVIQDIKVKKLNLLAISDSVDEFDDSLLFNQVDRNWNQVDSYFVLVAPDNLNNKISTFWKEVILKYQFDPQVKEFFKKEYSNMFDITINDVNNSIDYIVNNMK